MFRNAIVSTALIAVVSTGLATSAQAQEVVETVEGSVRGVAEDGVISWKGIPFAAPPVGDLRWRAPQPVDHWDGELDATAYANDCMQLPFPSDAAPLGTPPAEDCLYINVWRPDSDATDLPVLVWIYGGGFVNGGASPPTYSGNEMARQDVIFVSFNYRLGRFGYFAHPALTEADADNGMLGNYGYMDQIAALHWVQRNIAAFGGDPDKVTISGESAGGGSVHALVTSPLTDGLIDGAVVMSGGNGGGLGGGGLAESEQLGVAFAEANGIAADAGDALARLRALSAEEVVDGLNIMGLMRPDGPLTYSGPMIDGRVSVSGGVAYAGGLYRKVPMMIGATSADMGGQHGMMIAGAREIERVLADQGRPVYAYRFSYVAEVAPTGSAALGTAEGALHASDIPYFFDTQDIRYGDQTTDRDNGMGEIMSTYLANFVKTGNPNGEGLTAWPTYSRSADVIMDFTTEGTAVAGPDPWTAETDAFLAAGN